MVRISLVSLTFLLSAIGAYAACIVGEIKTTTAGAQFTCEDMPLLGVAWKDPEGLIWGDTAIKSNGSTEFEWKAAYNFCLNLNPETERLSVKEALDKNQQPTKGYFLPRKDDYKSLKQLMSLNGRYIPQILSNFPDGNLWTSTLDWPSPDANGIEFDSREGSFWSIAQFARNGVHCVAK